MTAPGIIRSGHFTFGPFAKAIDLATLLGFVADHLCSPSQNGGPVLLRVSESHVKFRVKQLFTFRIMAHRFEPFLPRSVSDLI